MALVMLEKYWRYFLTAGILFHTGILFIHGLFSFCISMTGALILYLGPVKDYTSFSNNFVLLKQKLRV